MPQLLQVEKHAFPDRDLVPLVGQEFHQPDRVPIGPPGGVPLAGHGVGDDPKLREQLLCFGAHQQRQGGIQAAGNAEDEIPYPRRVCPRRQAVSLDLQDPAAARVPFAVIGRHEGVSRHRIRIALHELRQFPGAHLVGSERLDAHRHPPIARLRRVFKAVLPPPVMQDAGEVDHRRFGMRASGKDALP